MDTNESNDDGGPAFPSDFHVGWTDEGLPTRAPGHTGMSLRDYFVASAPKMVEADSNDSWLSVVCGVSLPPKGDEPAWLAFRFRCEAIMRYRYADAMLRARREPQP